MPSSCSRMWTNFDNQRSLCIRTVTRTRRILLAFPQARSTVKVRKDPPGPTAEPQRDPLQHNQADSSISLSV